MAIQSQHVSPASDQPIQWDREQMIARVAAPRLSSDDLVHIFRETQHAAHHGYTAPSGRRVTIDPASVKAMQEGTNLFHRSPAVNSGLKNRFATEVRIVEQDSLQAAKTLVDQEKHPLVLNLANARSPGGGVRVGSRAQEESLFRCTNYDDGLNPKHNPYLARQLPTNHKGKPRYRIPEVGCILTPFVTVIRGRTFTFLEESFQVTTLASAAYDLNPDHWGGARSSESPPSKPRYGFAKGTMKKIRAQLAVAANSGHTDLVLGAFGCGAFRNDPKVVSGIYRKLLEKAFPGVFQSITFAILGGSEKAQQNIDAFTAAFRSWRPQRDQVQPDL